MSREKEIKNELWSAFRSRCGDRRTAFDSCPGTWAQRAEVATDRKARRRNGRQGRQGASMRSDARRRKTVHGCMAKC